MRNSIGHLRSTKEKYNRRDRVETGRVGETCIMGLQGYVEEVIEDCFCSVDPTAARPGSRGKVP